MVYACEKKVVTVRFGSFWSCLFVSARVITISPLCFVLNQPSIVAAWIDSVYVILRANE